MDPKKGRNIIIKTQISLVLPLILIFSICIKANAGSKRDEIRNNCQ